MCSGTGLKRPPRPEAIACNIQRYETLGLSVNISELDVRTSGLAEGVDKDAAQSAIYHDTVQGCFKEKACSGVTFWGFTDKHTWIHEFYGDDKPLLWDKEYKKKPAYFGVLQGLKDVGRQLVVDWSKWQASEPANAQSQIAQSSTAKPDWELE